MLYLFLSFLWSAVENRWLAGRDRLGWSAGKQVICASSCGCLCCVDGHAYFWRIICKVILVRTVIEFMGSYIQIDSISIDLANSIDKSDAGKCEHFSIRGYVSEIRKKDWKICWPFPVHESEEKPSLPPLDVPKFRCWCCRNCRQEIAAKYIDNDQTDFHCCSTGCRSDSNCSSAALKSGIQQDTMPDTLDRREIDLNNSTNMSCGNDCLPISNEKEKKAAVVHNRITELEIGLEDNLNLQVTSVASPKVYPGLIQELHINKRGFEGNEVSDVELATSNLKCMDRSSGEIYNGRTISADDQCQKVLRKSCTILGEGTIVVEADNITERTTGHPPLESVACNHAGHTGNTENMVENDFQDHLAEKSTGLSRRRPRKVRLLTDLLSANGDLKTEQITMQASPSHGTSNVSAALQTLSIFPGKVDVQEDLTLTNIGQSKKRKSLLDEEQRTASMCFQRVENDAQKLEGDAKTMDTVLDTRPKDVLPRMGLQDAVKDYWSKPEIERSHTMGNKKNKKIQVIDDHLISEPHQGQQRENEDTMDAVNKAYTSKTLSSRLDPQAFTGKGMDYFPFPALIIENEFNLSKGKGKMLQDVGELDSLSCQKNDMLVEDSFAFPGEKVMSNMPEAIPISSAQGALNGKGREEGLHLSLNSYLAAQVYNKKCIHQIENRLPFSLPLQEGTSKVHQLMRKETVTNVFGEPSIPSKHITNAISEKGACCEEITGARNTGKTVEPMEQLGIMKRYSDQTAEVSEQGTVDDIPMEIVELLAKNQYERCLPDGENRSSLLEKSTIKRKAQVTAGAAIYGKGELSLLKEGQKEKTPGKHGKNGMITRGENAKPSKRKPVQYFSPFDGNHLGMNNLCPPQSHFGFEVSQSQKKPSSGIQFSAMGSSQLGSARNCKFNGSIVERGSSDVTLQAQGGCSLHKTILQQDEEASRIWASLSPSHVSLGYDVPKKVVSQPTSSNMDITSFRPGTLHKQNMKRDIDLNYTNLNATDIEKLNRNMGPGTFSGMNSEYTFPCKHNGMERHQNLRGSLDLYSNETIPAMHLLSLMDAGMQSRTPFNVGVSAQMLKRPSYRADCNSKLEISTSKIHGTLKRQSSDYYSRSYLSDKSHGCFLGSPTFVASSSIQHDKKFMRATGGRNSTKSGKKEKLKSPKTLQNRGSKQFSWPRLETETPLQRKLEVHGTHETSVPLKIISGNSCMVNRNPADFTMPETGNAYMIRGEDLKFEKSIPKSRPRFPTPHGYKQQRNLKATKMKEHAKH